MSEDFDFEVLDDDGFPVSPKKRMVKPLSFERIGELAAQGVPDRALKVYAHLATNLDKGLDLLKLFKYEEVGEKCFGSEGCEINGEVLPPRDVAISAAEELIARDLISNELFYENMSCLVDSREDLKMVNLSLAAQGLMSFLFDYYEEGEENRSFGISEIAMSHDKEEALKALDELCYRGYIKDLTGERLVFRVEDIAFSLLER